MKDPQFSAEFLAKLGVQSWQENGSFVSARSLKTPPKPQTDYVEPVYLLEPDEDVTERLAEAVAETVVAVESDAVRDVIKPAVDKVPFIVIGEDLSQFWQNDAAPEWQLWKNICDAFGWDNEQIPFYDTLHLVTEETIFVSLEEIMEMEVDWVLSMDSESIFAEHLQEGLQLKTLPSLSAMLSDAYAKKTFFQTLSHLSRS